jgi:WD40 repeat protein
MQMAGKNGLIEIIMPEQTLSVSAEQHVPLLGALPQVVRVFGDLRLHTDGDLQLLAFDSQGRLWSIEDPGVLREWNPTTGNQLRATFLSDLETLWAINPNAGLVASAADDVSLWETSSGKVLDTIPQSSWVTAVAFGPQAKLFVTGHDDGIVRVWEVASRGLRHEFPGPKRPISAVALNAAGTLLASAGEDRVICLWDLETGRLAGTLKGHTDRIQALDWHPKGHRLVSGGWDTTARVWNTQTFEPIILLNEHSDQVTALAFSPDGSLLACADSARAIHVWDAEAGKSLHVLKEHDEEIRCLAFSPDGRLLASGGADQVIHLWDPRQGKLLSGRGDHILLGTEIVVSPDGSRLASTCGGAGLHIWDTRSNESHSEPGALATGAAQANEVGQSVLLPLTSAPPNGTIHVLAGSPDGRLLAGGGSDNRVHIWEAATGKIHSILEGQKGKVAAAAFSPDGATLASASDVDGMVWLWKLSNREPILVIPEAADACTVETLAFHPQGRLLAVGGIDWLATGGSDGAVSIWDVHNNCAVYVFDRGATRIAFDSAGRWLAAAGLSDSILVWDMEQKTLARELSGHSQAVTSVAFSPDGRWLASGSDDRTLRLWNAQSGEIEVVCPLDTQVKALCFSPDGRFLYTGNGNTTSYQLEVKRLLEADLPAP